MKLPGFPGTRYPFEILLGLFSGSPVFNQKWELVALHHAGPSFSKSDANEGLLIGSVFDAIRLKIAAAQQSVA